MTTFTKRRKPHTRRQKYGPQHTRTEREHSLMAFLFAVSMDARFEILSERIAQGKKVNRRDRKFHRYLQDNWDKNITWGYDPNPALKV